MEMQPNLEFIWGFFIGLTILLILYASSYINLIKNKKNTHNKKSNGEPTVYRRIL